VIDGRHPPSDYEYETQRTKEMAMFAKFVELYIITVLVNYTDCDYYEIYRI